MVPGIVRRRSVAALLGAAAAACASEGRPPGGPPDSVPPALVESSPADRAVNARPDQSITLVFDEVLDPRLAPRLPDLVVVNPDVPEFEYEIDDETVTLVPVEPMLDGVTYIVTLRPGIADRDGNATTGARRLLFSVGGEEPIPLSVVRATIVRDTVPAARARYRLENAETGFSYRFEADSAGRLELEGIEFGPYAATAWLEQAGGPGWQMTDEPGARDTFELGPRNRAHEATYRIAVVDTTAPVVLSATATASRVLSVRTDDRLAGEDPPPETAVRVWAGPPRDAWADVPTDSIPLETVRGEPLAVTAVERTGPSEIRIALAFPLEKGRFHRVELVGVENVDGLAAEADAGLTFLPEYEGPAVWPAAPIEWPEAEP